MTENEMVGWHHGLNGHEFEQMRGDGEGQGSLVCCSSWGHEELDMAQQLNNNIVEIAISLSSLSAQSYIFQSVASVDPESTPQ